MRNISYILSIFLLLGCKGLIKKDPSPNKEKETVKEIKSDNSGNKKELETEKKLDNSFFSFTKKPCSGDCPVFEVIIKKDSTLNFNGISLTNKLGNHSYKLSNKEFEKLYSALEASNFDNLKSSHQNEGNSDYSENLFKYQGKEVKVILWKDAPKELLSIYTIIEDLLYKNQFLSE